MFLQLLCCGNASSTRATQADHLGDLADLTVLRLVVETGGQGLMGNERAEPDGLPNPLASFGPKRGSSMWGSSPGPRRFDIFLAVRKPKIPRLKRMGKKEWNEKAIDRESKPALERVTVQVRNTRKEKRGEKHGSDGTGRQAGVDRKRSGKGKPPMVPPSFLGQITNWSHALVEMIRAAVGLAPGAKRPGLPGHPGLRPPVTLLGCQPLFSSFSLW